jgi:sugar phosphate isomerase/epimerase
MTTSPTKPNSSPALDLVFWTASVRTRPFEDQLKAAAAGGFTSFALSPDGYHAAKASGLSDRDMMGMAADAGAPLRHLDTVTDWAPVRYPSWLEGPLKDRFDVSSDDILAMVDTFGMETILAFPGFDGTEGLELEELADGFGRFADRAQERGAQVQLEFTPVTGLRTLAAAWDIVRTAASPNSGLTIDVWHFYKGGLDLELLKAIPAEYLWSVQLTDGTKGPSAENLLEEGLNGRMFPGEGELPIQEILQILHEKGNLRQAGPETFSAAANAMAPEDAGRRDGETSRAALTAAGFAVPPLERERRP